VFPGGSIDLCQFLPIGILSNALYINIVYFRKHIKTPEVHRLLGVSEKRDE